jgi:hypothetical protein
LVHEVPANVSVSCRIGKARGQKLPQSRFLAQQFIGKDCPRNRRTPTP